MLNKEEIEKMEVDNWLEANEIPNFIRNYIEQLEFENSALKTEHKFNIDRIEQMETKRKYLIEHLEEDINNYGRLIEIEYDTYKEYYARTGGYPNQMKLNVHKFTGAKNMAEQILNHIK